MLMHVLIFRLEMANGNGKIPIPIYCKFLLYYITFAVIVQVFLFFVSFLFFFVQES